jgi:GST-like protein
VNRLFGVTDPRLADQEYLAGAYSIAEIACVGWTRGWKRYPQKIADFPHLARWLDAVLGAQRFSAGSHQDSRPRRHDLATHEEARKTLFG